jgi:2-phosphosulfolactate phosphatase
MKATVLLSNEFDENDPGLRLREQICLVIDVLRATSTITSALAAGAGKVIVSRSTEEAFSIRRCLGGTVLCGEEKAVKIEGFDYDNSPRELSRLDLTGKTVVIKTTNGTKSFVKVQKAKVVLNLSLLNMSYTMDQAVRRARRRRADLLFLCSGKLGMISYDDVYVAGAALRHLIDNGVSVELEDTAELALAAALREQDAYGAMLKSRSARCALAVGLQEDIRFSSEVNRYGVTGTLKIERVCEALGEMISIFPL